MCGRRSTIMGRRLRRRQVLEQACGPRFFSNGGSLTRPAGAQGPPPTQASPPATPPQDRPPVASPSNILDREINAQPPMLDRSQLDAAGRMTQTEAAELAGVLVPRVDLQNDTEGYGYPKGSRVYKINMQQAWLLALMNARFYQFNLEQVYLAAIPVTLQRFIFGPQFFAGLSPVTSPLTPGVLGGANAGFPSTPGVATTNTFTYATRFSPAGQVSTLNLGTGRGVRQAVPKHRRSALDGFRQPSTCSISRAKIPSSPP